MNDQDGIMLIIVEGCDGAGKSHLIKRLRKKLDGENVSRAYERMTTLFHRGPPTGDPLDEYVVPLFDYSFYDRPEHIICDRWHWGERIYPTIFNRPSKMDDARWRYMEMFLLSRGAIVVWLDTDPKTVADSLNKRGDNMVTARDADRIIDMYHEVAKTSLLPSMRIDRSIPIDEILDFAQDATNHHAYVSRVKTYVGPHRPHTVFVGDVRNGQHAEGVGTAFMPYGATSGHYLMSNLPDWFFKQPNRVGLMNACDIDDIVYALGIVEPRYIVALGNNAHRQLTKVGVPFFGSAPHPQFIRRFHNDGGAAYGAMLSDVGIFGRDDRKWRP